MSHLQEEAELYALGMLDAAERERVDAHVASCDACVRRLGEAERGLAVLIDAAAVPRVRSRSWPLALAAALGVALAASIVTSLGLQRSLDADGTMLAWIATGHFAHSSFQTPAGAPLDAKAVYERHGHWYTIVARGAPLWHVTLVEPDGVRVPVTQSFTRRGDASVLLIPNPPPIATIELDDRSGAIVGTARPSLEK